MRAFVLALMIASLFFACKREGGDKTVSIRQDTELAQVRPKKPVKVHLKRKEGGEYSWEITGEDVEKVIEADRLLQQNYRGRQ